VIGNDITVLSPEEIVQSLKTRSKNRRLYVIGAKTTGHHFNKPLNALLNCAGILAIRIGYCWMKHITGPSHSTIDSYGFFREPDNFILISDSPNEISQQTFQQSRRLLCWEKMKYIIEQFCATMNYGCSENNSAFLWEKPVGIWKPNRVVCYPL
jgi:hypothetical protein